MSICRLLVCHLSTSVVQILHWDFLSRITNSALTIGARAMSRKNYPRRFAIMLPCRRRCFVVIDPEAIVSRNSGCSIDGHKKRFDGQFYCRIIPFDTAQGRDEKSVSIIIGLSSPLLCALSTHGRSSIQINPHGKNAEPPRKGWKKIRIGRCVEIYI